MPTVNNLFNYVVMATTTTRWKLDPQRLIKFHYANYELMSEDVQLIRFMFISVFHRPRWSGEYLKWNLKREAHRNIFGWWVEHPVPRGLHSATRLLGNNAGNWFSDNSLVFSRFDSLRRFGSDFILDQKMQVRSPQLVFECRNFQLSNIG